ncbi:hypothetical protein [Nocardioides aequoreus]|uniref:hypothetical protein n=1 Tax=Nocardioides aequoreus TaxID=397278 RepID=UPI0004C46414|nr:hypothetical protein [Nocardioides aequoreus]
MTEAPHDDQGSVSEVANLGDGEPISPDQSVAGAPDDGNGEVQEGRQGPNAVTGDETQDGEDLGADAQSRDGGS